MEKVRLKYLFDKIKVNFHAILLILHVFQADMIYMYRNSDVVNLMFPADLFLEIDFEMYNLVAGKQVQYFFFFLISSLGAKRLLYAMQKITKTSHINNFMGRVFIAMYHFDFKD